MTVACLSNIASHLPMAAEQRPHQMAVVCPHGHDRAGRVSYTHLTFEQLDRESDMLARGLHEVGIKRGTRAVLMVKPSLELFALTFALFKSGAVPVLVDPGMGARNISQCLAEAEPEAFIAIPKAQAARRVLGWGKSNIQTVITIGPRLMWGGHTLNQIRDMGKETPEAVMFDPDENDPAAILFTSGSTGVPKGAVYTHAIFQGQVESLREIFSIEPGEVDLATFPLFALFAPALGMTAIIPDMDTTRPATADPRKLIKAIEDFGVNNLFASPALLNGLSLYGEEHQVKLPTLKRIVSAGAPVPADVIQRAGKMLPPGVQIFTPYGATESLPTAVIGSDEILSETRKQTEMGGGVCVGKPAPAMEIRIIHIDDAAIETWSDKLIAPPREIGEIVVKGPVVSREYFNRAESTRLAKIMDPENGGFWHRMGDLGYVDEQGRLWVCGRKAHRVQTESGTMFTLPCEAVFNTHPAVYRTALVGVPENGKQKPVLCVELLPSAARQNRDTIRRELLERGAAHEHTRPIATILFHPALPVDVRHNSKIFREKLALWAARNV